MNELCFPLSVSSSQCSLLTGRQTDEPFEPSYGYQVALNVKISMWTQTSVEVAPRRQVKVRTQREQRHDECAAFATSDSDRRSTARRLIKMFAEEKHIS